MKIFYFTATGNSLYAAKSLGGELLSIPKLMAEGRYKFEDDVIGIVTPIYGLGVPRLVENFLAKAELKADYRFAVMTYGNMAAGGLKYLEAAAKKKGTTFDYTNEVLMVDNYLPMFDIDDQLKKESSKGIEEKLKTITADIAARKHSLISKNPATNALGCATNALFSRFWRNGAEEKFFVTDACNSCGTCARVCPVKNIRLEGKPVFQHKCEGCLACINHCPKSAIHLKNEKSAARFRNRNVTLQEIIDANEQ